MLRTNACVARRSPLCWWLASVIFGIPAATAFGQFQQAVGGISIDATGVLANAEKDVNGLRQFWLDNLQKIPGDLNQPTKLRKISLRAIDEALAAIVSGGKRLPDDLRFLAGLQRVEYVLVYPERKDIVLAGYAEGWKVDDRGNMVGAKNGRPLMQLDDLLIALRTAEAAARGSITCSIDPTAAGLARVQNMPGNVMAGNVVVPAADPQGVGDAIARELGPQTISFHGLPPESRFAHVLLAADFRMKRLGMNFDPSPVKGFTSYLNLIKSFAKPVSQNLLPRWWLTTNYKPLLTDGQDLAWQLRGQGVKTMSEDDFLSRDGSRQQTGKASPTAQRWADMMTRKFDDLSLKEPVFGELRNCMDLAVVAALVFKRDLFGKAGLTPAILLSSDDFPTHRYKTPQQVDSKASVVGARYGYIISVSGGVEINSWGEVSQTETSDSLIPLRDQAADGRGDRWWWN